MGCAGNPMGVHVTVAGTNQTGQFSHREILTIFAGLMAGMFLAALDQTIVATSIRTIADDLNGLSMQAWVTTAYLITSTLTTPLYGKLSDIYGRRPLFLFAIVLFVLGSILCTFSESMYQLAGFRAVQGLGAGGLMSVAMAIIGDIVSPRERARYQGYLVSVFATASVLGPLAGGFLAGQASILGIRGWRWVFLVNVPIGIVALLIVLRVLNLPHTPRRSRVDWPGAVALAVGLVPLLLVAEQGRSWGWLSAPALCCFAVGLAGLGLFVLVERYYGDDALLPSRLLRYREFSICSAALVVCGMVMFGGLAGLPLYLQIVKGLSPTESGLLTLPLLIGVMGMSTASGRIISRTGKLRRWPIFGTVLMLFALVLLGQVGAATPIWVALVGMLLFGMALGASTQPLTVGMQSAMPARDLGVVSATASLSRQLGGTLGTAVILSILFGTVAGKITSAYRVVAPTPAFQAALADPQVRSDRLDQSVLRGLADAASSAPSGTIQSKAALSLDDTSFIAHLDHRIAQPFLDGFAGAISLTFLVSAVLAVVGLALVIALPEIPLRGTSGIAARLAEELTTPDIHPDTVSIPDEKSPVEPY